MATAWWIVIIFALGIAAYYYWYTKIRVVTTSTQGVSINSYLTGISNLIGAADTFSSSDGSFTSRLGNFFGQLAT